MGSIRVQVSLQPSILIQWPDGRQASLSTDEVSQLLQILLTEELLWVDCDPDGPMLSGLALELRRDDEGRWIVAGSAHPSTTGSR